MTDTGPTQSALPIFAPLLETNSQKLPYSVVGSPVKTYPLPENAPVLQKAHALVFGLNSPVLLAIYDPVSCFWRTSQASLLLEDQPLLPTLPKWGTWDTGALYQQPTPERHIDESDGSAWLTPSAMEMASTGQGKLYITENGTARRMNSDGSSSNLGLSHMVKAWTTPKNRDYRTGSDQQSQRITRKIAKGWGVTDLNDQVQGQLNPAWVEMLMGYPQGWADISGPPVQDSRSSHTSRRALYRASHIARKGSKRLETASYLSASTRLRARYVNTSKPRTRRKRSM